MYMMRVCSQNGPCPLLALANALCLRGAITIHSDVSRVTFEELTSLIAEYMLDRNRLSDNLETRANQRQNLSDCMTIFPRLNRGLDINVRFDAVDGMEYSEDLVLFDALGVRLLHGWLVDPQETTAARIIGQLTYNQLVEKLIEGASPARPAAPTADGQRTLAQ